MNLKVTLLTDKDLDEKYGSNRIANIGECFKIGEHYYMQRESDVLHLKYDIINSCHNSVLKSKKLVKINEEEFYTELRTVIFNLDIFRYTKSF